MINFGAILPNGRNAFNMSKADLHFAKTGKEIAIKPPSNAYFMKRGAKIIFKYKVKP